jgi:AraC family transcriptional regulator
MRGESGNQNGEENHMGNGESHFGVETQIRLPGITAEMGEYRWDGPYETIFDSHSTYIACLILTKLPAVFSGYYMLDDIAGECGDVGEVTFSPANTTMYQRSAGLPQRVLRCTFDADRFNSVTGLDGSFGKRELSASLNIKESRIGETMLRLAQEMEAPGFASNVLVESFALGVMVQIARYFRATRERCEARRAVLARWQMRRINQYLNEFEGPAPTLSDLAAQCGVSRGHLNRLFKATTGVTLHEYVSDIRMKRAKSYLIDTNLALKEISFRLGFSQPPSFSLAFRNAVGETPRRYRQRLKNRSQSTAVSPDRCK